MNTLIEKIMKLKKEKNAFIMAHNYQPGEIQDIADVTGDSLGLSQKAVEAQSDMIVFCGVRFMAESAKILSPEKKVFIPVTEAGCPMADMITGDEIILLREKHPDAIFVAYVNSSAETKSQVDMCVTSANAVDKVKQLPPHRPVYFLPDQNLGNWVKKNLPQRKIIAHDGYCYVHHQYKADDIDEMKKLYPNHPVLIHPEAPLPALEKADYVASTSGMIKIIKENKIKKAVIGTEIGIIHQFMKIFPDGEYVPLRNEAICADMKKISLQNLYESLQEEKHEIKLPEQLMDKARVALERMIQSKVEF